MLVAGRLEQHLVRAGVDPHADDPPVGVDHDVDGLVVLAVLGGVDLGEVAPAHRAGRAAEDLGADRLAVVADDRVRAGGHRPSERVRQAEVARQDQPMDLAGALADLQDLRVAVVARDRELLDVAGRRRGSARPRGRSRPPPRWRRASRPRPRPRAGGPGPSATRRGRWPGARSRSWRACRRSSTGWPGTRRSAGRTPRAPSRRRRSPPCTPARAPRRARPPRCARRSGSPGTAEKPRPRSPSR